MNISPIQSNNFLGRLVRNTRTVTNAQGKDTQKSTSREYVESFYNRQIKTIEKQKKHALEFDDFMHSDQVSKMIKELPAGDKIEINSIPSDDNIIEVNELLLIYKPSYPDYTFANLTGSEEDEISIQSVQKPNGQIDKKGIIDWLQRIKDFNN